MAKIEEVTLTKRNVETAYKFAYSGKQKFSPNISEFSIPEIFNGEFIGLRADWVDSKRITVLDDNLFWGFSNLQKVTIPNSVKKIGKNCFKDCRNLVKITISAGVTSIGDFAFEGCTSLIIEIPSTVNFIGRDAFKGVLQVYYEGSAIGAPWGALDFINKSIAQAEIDNERYRLHNEFNIKSAELQRQAEEERLITQQMIDESNQKLEQQQIQINEQKKNFEETQKRLEEENRQLELRQQQIIEESNKRSAAQRAYQIEQQKKHEEEIQRKEEEKRQLELRQQQIIEESKKRNAAHRAYQLEQKKKYEEEIQKREEARQREIEEKRKIEEQLRRQKEQAKEQAELLRKYEEQRKAQEELERKKEELKRLEEEAEKERRERQLELERSTPQSVTLDEDVISILYSLSNDSVHYVDSKDVKEITYLDIPSCYIYDRQKYRINKIASNLFKDSKIKKVTILDESVEIIEKSAFQKCKYLEKITISEKSGLKYIKENAFKDCNLLKAIVIPSTVEEISNYAFENCKDLEDIEISDGVKLIGKRAFKGCSSVKEVNIPSSVKTISQKAFCECTSLQFVSISEGVKVIEESAFSDCDSLKEIVVPNSVNEIGYEAFYGIEKVVYNGSATVDSPWGAKSVIKSFDVADLPKVTNETVIPSKKTIIDKKDKVEQGKESFISVKPESVPKVYEKNKDEKSKDPFEDDFSIFDD